MIQPIFLSASKIKYLSFKKNKNFNKLKVKKFLEIKFCFKFHYRENCTESKKKVTVELIFQMNTG